MNPNAHPLSIAAELLWRQESYSGANRRAAQAARPARRHRLALHWPARRHHGPARAA